MADPSSQSEPYPLVKVVGISGSGKSTLVHALRQTGYNARPVSQEHSNISELWTKFGHPAVLIYLDVEHAVQAQRRPDIGWTPEALAGERNRLADARDHADLRIDTSTLSANAVLAIATAFLKHRGIAHAPHPLPDLPRTGGSTKPPMPR